MKEQTTGTSLSIHIHYYASNFSGGKRLYTRQALSSAASSAQLPTTRIPKVA